MPAFDFKTAQKALYAPAAQPAFVRVPEMRFLAVDGTGDPNAPDGAFSRAVEQLYTAAYTIKMSKLSGDTPAGYFDFVVPPLEGLWDMADGSAGVDYARKDVFRWTVMLRQPDFVTEETLAWARAEALRKKKPDIGDVRLFHYEEGLCVQCMHAGAYDDEPATVARLLAFLAENGAHADHGARRHHEIYLRDPRRTPVEKRRTVLRLPAATDAEIGAAAEPLFLPKS